MRNGLVSSAPRRVAVFLSLGAIGFLLAGCSGYVYVTPPDSHVTVSQGLPGLHQGVDVATKHKPVVRNIVVRQVVPGLTQKAGGVVKGNVGRISVNQTLPKIGQASTGIARQPGSFSYEYSPEYQ